MDLHTCIESVPLIGYGEGPLRTLFVNVCLASRVALQTSGALMPWFSDPYRIHHCTKSFVVHSYWFAVAVWCSQYERFQTAATDERQWLFLCGRHRLLRRRHPLFLTTPQLIFGYLADMLCHVWVIGPCVEILNISAERAVGSFMNSEDPIPIDNEPTADSHYFRVVEVDHT